MHAHITTRSRGSSHGHTESLTIEERISAFGDIEFKQRVVNDVVNVTARLRYITLEITPDRVSWREVTDEGYISSLIEWCEGNCSDDTPWQRDLQAEKAGY